MWLDNASQHVVDLFWRLTGETEAFPRNLERPLALGLPVALTRLPRLTLHKAEAWIRRRGVGFRFSCESRAVRGCLIAYRGHGIIFVDGADPDDERRFTVAHEIAHFMVDYWLPRRKAVQKLGGQITEVLDGQRKPSVNERLYAVLASTPIGVHTDLMEREEASTEVWDIESRADRIALALLAPPRSVLSVADVSALSFGERESAVSSLLCQRFGLPRFIARAYGRSLLDAIGKGPSWVETLRLRM